MSAPTPTSHTVRSIDVPLGPGRQTLRVSLTRDEHGEPESVILAAGFGGAGSDTPFNRPHWAGDPLQLPGSALGPLREALTALAEEP